MGGRATPSEAAQGPVTGEAPLTPVQQRFFAQARPARHHFNMGLLLRPREALDAGLLARAAAALEAHHDALRLRFRQEEDGSWTQWHDGPRRARPADGLRPLGPAGGGAEAGDRGGGRAGAAQPGAVARAAAADGVVRAGRRGDRAAAGDGAPPGGRRGELARAAGGPGERLHAARARATSVELPPKTTSWKAWAERLAEHARSEALAEEAAFWLAQARTEVAPLPLDDADGREHGGAAARRGGVADGGGDGGAAAGGAGGVPHADRRGAADGAGGRAGGAGRGSGASRVEMEGHGREEETSSAWTCPARWGGSPPCTPWCWSCPERGARARR